MQEVVVFEAFVAGAEKLNAALVALAALADRDDGDRAHQAQQRACYALVALLRALESGYDDAVNERQADPLPGVGNQTIVAWGCGEVEEVKIENIYKPAGFDDITVIGWRERVSALVFHGGVVGLI